MNPNKYIIRLPRNRDCLQWFRIDHFNRGFPVLSSFGKLHLQYQMFWLSELLFRLLLHYLPQIAYLTDVTRLMMILVSWLFLPQKEYWEYLNVSYSFNILVAASFVCPKGGIWRGNWAFCVFPQRRFTSHLKKLLQFCLLSRSPFLASLPILSPKLTKWLFYGKFRNNCL